MVTIRFTCLVGGRENGKKGVVDHLGERNEEGGMVTFSMLYGMKSIQYFLQFKNDQNRSVVKNLESLA